MTKPTPGQLWRHNKSGQHYRIIKESDDYVFAGQLRKEWDASSDRPALRAEIESLVGMVLYQGKGGDYVRREADFLEKFTLVVEELDAEQRRRPTFSHHLGIYQQGLFKIGVQEYFKKTGQSLGTRYGYDD
jgi:hypothetical protein